MMRVICLLLVSLFALKVNAQQYTKFNGYGFAADRMRSDSISIHPSDTIRNKAARSIAVLNGVFYIADGTKWKVVGTDTTSLSNRINLKLNIADTSSMLSPYLRTANYSPADTTSLSNRINLKLNIADTSSMLSSYSKLKSVGLTMPSAFSVANSPLTSDGTIAVSGAGTAAQYVRGDGQLANFPSNVGGGSSVNYYLNGSVNQGTIGGNTYYQLSKVPIIGAGTNFTRTNAQGNGYIASFITDAADPALLNIPGGNWNIEFYFQASSNGSNPSFYAELYKVSSANVFTLIGSGSTNPEGITNGTAVDQYFTSIPVPQTALLATDRIAIRIFVTPSGRTITLHTEDNNLCEVLTTFSTGLNALNGLTNQVQYFATGTSGSDFNISSATDTHTFNLPTASGTNRGLLLSSDWTTFNGKIGAGDTATMLNPYSRGSGTSGQVGYWNATRSLTGSSNLFWDNANGRLGIGTASPSFKLDVNGTARVSSDLTVGTTSNSTTALTINSSSRADIKLRTNGSGDNAFTLYTLGGAIGSNYAQFGTNDGEVSGSQGGAIYTDSRTGPSPIRFMVKGTGTTAMTNAAQIYPTANMGLGTSSDAGYKLDVNGTARVQSDMIVNTVKIGLAGGSIATNIGIGYNTLVANSTGSNNIALGYQTLQSNSTGVINVGVGSFSLFSNSTGSNNSMNGVSSFYSNTTGSNNVGFGYNAGRYIANGTTGATIIDNSILIGYNTKVLANSQTNQIVIGYNETGLGSNTTIIGNSSTTITALRGNTLIGTTTDVASSKLTVESTTQGFLPPRMTTAQRDLISSPAAGLIIYNTSTNKHQGYNGSTWNDFY